MNRRTFARDAAVSALAAGLIPYSGTQKIIDAVVKNL